MHGFIKESLTSSSGGMLAIKSPNERFISAFSRAIHAYYGSK
jgi:hypothetical protein